MQRTDITGYTHAGGSSELGKMIIRQVNVGMKPDITSQVTARREIIILPMGWKQGKVELYNEQNKQFDPGG